MFPITGVLPVLPTLPTNASPTVKSLHNELKKLRTNWAVRESQLRKAGNADDIYKTLTAKKYKAAEKTFKDAIADKTINVSEPSILSKRQTAEFKHTKSMATGDRRATNQGRPAVRERQYDQIEATMRNDNNPVVQKMLHRYDIKLAKDMDPKLARQRRKEMLLEYAKLRNLQWFVKLFE